MNLFPNTPLTATVNIIHLEIISKPYRHLKVVKLHPTESRAWALFVIAVKLSFVNISVIIQVEGTRGAVTVSTGWRKPIRDSGRE